VLRVDNLTPFMYGVSGSRNIWNLALKSVERFALEQFTVDKVEK